MEKVDIVISELTSLNDVGLALNLAYNVYRECNYLDYTDNGLKYFRELIFTDKYKSGLTIYGAFDKFGCLVGMIGYRYVTHHLAMLFVQSQYHNLGIGFKLLKFVISNEQEGTLITVNASTYAENFYRHFGFEYEITDDEVTYNGLSFYKMVYRVKSEF